MENNLSLSKRRLLLADDSVTIQKVVNLTFADEDIEVIAVSDGDTAMRKFNEAIPDLVMADVNMPGLDGYQICEKIKQDARTKRIPVILLVGSFEPFDEEKALSVGADDFLTKPFQSILQLINKVSGLLDVNVDEEDFLAPIENPPAPISSFADALKLMPTDEFDSADDTIENLGDSGMDDEMIQTAQVGVSSADRVPKFETKAVYQSFAEDLDQISSKSRYNSAANDYPPRQDWAQTQPLSKNDLQEISAGANSGDTIPVLAFDDADLLDFPQTMTQDASFEINLLSDYKPNKKEQETQLELRATEDQTSPNSPQTFNLSPEMIEAIADKVVEKLSNKIIKKIVREAIAQTADKKKNQAN